MAKVETVVGAAHHHVAMRWSREVFESEHEPPHVDAAPNAIVVNFGPDWAPPRSAHPWPRHALVLSRLVNKHIHHKVSWIVGSSYRDRLVFESTSS